MNNILHKQIPQLSDMVTMATIRVLVVENKKATKN